MLTWQERKEISARNERKANKLYQKKYYRRKRAEKYAKNNLDAASVMESKQPQFMSFIMDCCIPSLDHWTKVRLIYAYYRKYCKAISEEPLYSITGFGTLMARHYIRREIKGGAEYSLVLRKDVIVEDTSELPEIFATTLAKDAALSPPKPELMGENWGEGEDESV